MFKKACVYIIAVCLCLGPSGCAVDVGADAQNEPFFVQDIMLGSDDTDDGFSEEPPVITEPTKEQNEQALLEQAQELEGQIQALMDKLSALEQLRASYEAENPPDLEAKLARCDALIADTHEKLSALRERLEQNRQTRQPLLEQPENEEPALIAPEPAEDLDSHE